MEKNTKKPSCAHCHVQNVCFMPKETSEFQENFKVIIPSKPPCSPEILSFEEVVAMFKKFIAENCRFYKEQNNA